MKSLIRKRKNLKIDNKKSFYDKIIEITEDPYRIYFHKQFTDFFLQARKQPQIRFNITRVTGSIPETSTLQDQTNSVESAGSDSPNSAPSTTTNQSPQQQATIDTAELPSPRTEPPPPPKTENQSSCEQKISTTTIDEPGQLTIEMINHTKECLTKIKKSALWIGSLSEEFNKKTINYTYKDRTSKSVNLNTATTVFITVWSGDGEIPTKELLHDALMYAISVTNNKDLLLYPSKSNNTADEIIKAYKDLFYQTFTGIINPKLSLAMHLTKFGKKQKIGTLLRTYQAYRK